MLPVRLLNTQPTLQVFLYFEQDFALNYGEKYACPIGPLFSFVFHYEIKIKEEVERLSVCRFDLGCFKIIDYPLTLKLFFKKHVEDDLK